MLLERIIIDKIKDSGPVSFRDFMETALYYPGEGYYSSAGCKIGKQGDFYTSPYLSELFGRMLAVQIEELWHALGRLPLTVVEYGAGNGDLAHDILLRLKKNSALYETMRYAIIEKSAQMKSRQQLLLTEKVCWYDDIEQVTKGGNINGLVLANEVLDNFAVHQVLMQEELMEVFVDYENGFKETLKAAVPPLQDYLQALNIHLPPGFRTEINLEAIRWITDIGKALHAGAVLTIDYGYGSQELYSNQRQNGTLLCYHKHSVSDAFFNNLGQQDITAHVNFSALKHFGQQQGLDFGGYTSQGRFLQSLGLCEQLALEESTGKQSEPANPAKIMMLQKLLLDMGSSMKVLALQKNLAAPMRGMRFPMYLD